MSLKVTFSDANVSQQYDGSAELIRIPAAKGKLFIGDRDSAAFLQLRSRDCSHVVNCQGDLHGLSREKDITYLNIDPEVSSKGYEESYQFIDAALTAGSNVTVLCQTGLAKAAAIVLYYVMKRQNISLADAHRMLVDVKEKKKKTLNLKPDLVKQLMVLEKILRKTATVTLDGRAVVYTDGSFSAFFGGGGNRGGGKNNGGGFPFVPFAVFVGVTAALFGGLLVLTGGKL